MKTAGQVDLVRIKLLGDFHVSLGELEIPSEHFRLRKARNLVKLLALSDNHNLHREELMEILWPEGDPGAAANNLHQALFAARRAFILAGADPGLYLTFENETLHLASKAPIWVDVENFDQAAGMARREKTPQAYQAALELYSGDLLPEDRYADWTLSRREQLRQEYLGLLQELGNLYEANSEYQAAIEVCKKIVQNDTLNEEAYVNLMRLYAMNGQRQAAVRQYQLLQEILLHELEIEPDPSSTQVYQQILSGEYAPQKSVLPVSKKVLLRHNLPTQLTPFIGRLKEMPEIKNRLAQSRLVTLTGAGGVGKTRLAIEVALSLVGNFSDGVWLVEFASITDPELVLHTVAGLFGLREDRTRTLQAVLQDYVRSRQMLLVLDNCEHLVDTCAELTQKLLQASPTLHILATSREALEIPGEQVYSVPTLSTPGLKPTRMDENIGEYEAVQLFVDRASSTMPGFCVTPENAPMIVQICQHLDGIPLALELAAAHVNLLRVEQIASRLENRFALLSGGSRAAVPRQRTLRASIDWSYNLLVEMEQTLLHRLSVFSDGWTLEAAEAVCADDVLPSQNILEILTRLAHKSLVIVQRRQGLAARYWLLETIRQYATEKLTQGKGEAQILDRHLQYYLDLAENVTPKLKSEYFLEGMRELKVELENLRSALSWGLLEKETARGIKGVRLICALSSFWSRAGMLNEGHLWLVRGLASDVTSNPDNIALRGHLLCRLAYYELDFAKAYKAADESVSIFRETGDLEGLAEILVHLGVRLIHSDHAQGSLILNESIQLYRQLGDSWGLAYALTQRGRLAHEERDYQLVEACARESHDLFLKAGDRWNANIWPMGLLAHIAVQNKDFEGARSYIELCLQSAKESGETSAEFEAMMYHGIITYFLGDFTIMEADFHYVLGKYQELGGGNLGIVWALRCLGIAYKRQGFYHEAAAYFRKSLPLATESDDVYGIYSAIAGTAGTAVSLGQPRLGALLLGAVEALLTGYTKPLDPMDFEEYQRDLAMLKKEISDDSFEIAWAEGLELTQEQAIKAAYSVSPL
jgi:predicted ATPase/DNA-binding SARP family transcriptional activator